MPVGPHHRENEPEEKRGKLGPSTGHTCRHILFGPRLSLFAPLDDGWQMEDNKVAGICHRQPKTLEQVGESPRFLSLAGKGPNLPDLVFGGLCHYTATIAPGHRRTISASLSAPV